MAGVSGVNTRTRQPASPQAINVANPLARGLVFAFDGNNWRDAVTGAVATASGTPTRISTPRGIATYFSGSAYLSFGSKELWNVTGSVTILWLGSFDATSGAFRTIVSKTASNGTADTPFDAYINSGTGVARFFRASAAAYSAQDISVGDVGAGYHALFFADDGNPNDTGTGYVDDTPYVAIAAGGATSVTGTSAALRIGRRIDDATQLTGSVNGCFIWNRRLSAEEYRLLKANPWQLFAPQRTARIYSFPTGSGTTVSVPAGAITLTGYAPTVSFTAHQTIAVPKGALVLSAFAPTVSTSAAQTIAVPLASLTLTGFAPTVAATAHQTISVPAASLTLTAYAPTVYTTAVTSIAVPKGTLTLTGYAPTINYTANATIGVPAGALTLTGYAPTVIGGTSSVWTQVSAASGTWTPASLAPGTWTPQ